MPAAAGGFRKAFTHPTVTRLRCARSPDAQHAGYSIADWDEQRECCRVGEGFAEPTRPRENHDRYPRPITAAGFRKAFTHPTKAAEKRNILPNRLTFRPPSQYRSMRALMPEEDLVMCVGQNGTQWDTNKGSFHLPGGFGTGFRSANGRDSCNWRAKSRARNNLQLFATKIKGCFRGPQGAVPKCPRMSQVSKDSYLGTEARDSRFPPPFRRVSIVAFRSAKVRATRGCHSAHLGGLLRTFAERKATNSKRIL